MHSAKKTERQIRQMSIPPAMKKYPNESSSEFGSETYYVEYILFITAINRNAELANTNAD